MEKIQVEITGISPLLQHRFPVEGQQEAKKKNKKQTRDDVEKALYRLDDGTIYQPALHLIGALKVAGAKFQIPGRGKLTYKNMMGSGVVVITPDAIPHENQDYDVDARPVVISSTRGRVVRMRPMFNDWKLRFEMEYDEEEVDVATLKELLDYAGLRVGIGDFRPAKGGPFGRFMVTKFES